MRAMNSFTGFFLLMLVTLTSAADCTNPATTEQTMTPKINVYLDIIEQWKGKSIEGVLGHLTDDIVWHTATAIDPPLIGKDAARAWLQKYGGGVNNSRWRVVSYAETPTQLFVEGVEDYELPDGRRIAFPYSGAYDFSGDKICGWRDYFDRGLMVRLKNGEALPDYVATLNARPAIKPR